MLENIRQQTEAHLFYYNTLQSLYQRTDKKGYIQELANIILKIKKSETQDSEILQGKSICGLKENLKLILSSLGIFIS